MILSVSLVAHNFEGHENIGRPSPGHTEALSPLSMNSHRTHSPSSLIHERPEIPPPPLLPARFCPPSPNASLISIRPPALPCPSLCKCTSACAASPSTPAAPRCPPPLLRCLPAPCHCSSTPRHLRRPLCRRSCPPPRGPVWHCWKDSRLRPPSPLAPRLLPAHRCPPEAPREHSSRPIRGGLPPPPPPPRPPRPPFPPRPPCPHVYSS